MSMVISNAPRRTRGGKWNLIWLWLLGAVPGGFATALLVMLALGMTGTIAGAQFPAAHHFDTPWPVIIHGSAGVFFWVVAPLQFLVGLRRNAKELHRMLGTLLALAAFALALSALWMNHYFASPGGGLKYWGMAAMAFALLVSLGVAVQAALRGARVRHGAWMMRLTAVVYAGMTRVFVEVALAPVLGEASEIKIGLGIWLGLIINLAFVQYLLRRPKPNPKPNPKPKRATAVAG